MQLLQVHEPRKGVPPEYTMFDTALPLDAPVISVEKPRLIPWEHKLSKFHDVPFVLVFAFVVGGLGIIATDSVQFVYYLHQQRIHALWRQVVDTGQDINMVNTLVLIVLVTSAALLVGFFQLLGILLFYRAFVAGAFIVNLLVSIALGVYFARREMFKPLLVTLVFTIVVIIMACKLRHKIQFSANIIKIGSKMMRSTPSVWIVYMCMLTLNSLVLCLYFVIVYTSYITWKDDMDPNMKYYVASFLIFSGYYLTEVFQNSIQVIVGAIVAKWYFNSNVGTIDTIRNTFIKCFGSICLGSLFASLLSILKEIVIFLKPNDKFLNYPLLKPLWRVLEIFIICINYTLKYFNNYSYAYISIHSTSYIKSSIRMYKLYNHKGYSTLVSECVINLILRLYVVFSGLLAAGIAYCVIQLLQPEFVLTDKLFWVVITVSAVCGMQISRMIAMIVNAYVYVLFVCLIEHRDTMAETHLEEYKCIEKHLSPTVPKVK